MSVARVFDKDDAESTVCSGSELREGLGDLVPLDDGLADGGTAEIECTVVGGENRCTRTTEIDVGGGHACSRRDGEKTLPCAGLRGYEGEDDTAGGSSSQYRRAIG